MRRWLVTGGAGFIGSAFVRQTLADTNDVAVTVLDKLTYAGSRANLAAHAEDACLTFVHGDIADAELVGRLVQNADAVVNFAAETHVDRSILEPGAFLDTNVLGVHRLLDACRDETARASRGERARGPRFLQVSTDEVYGSVESGASREDDRLLPRSPYAAAKASAELFVRAYAITFGLDAVITRGANTYGPYQHPEKLVPLFITNAMQELPLPMYGDGLQRRDWLFVDDHASAIRIVLERGVAGEAYNVPGAAEHTNREVIDRLLARLEKPWTLVRSVTDRAGHDRRYAMDGAKLRALGWAPRIDFARGIDLTVDWYANNESWWRTKRAGEWDAYYARQYAARLETAVQA